jgi:hypothetical protein
LGKPATVSDAAAIMRTDPQPATVGSEQVHSILRKSTDRRTRAERRERDDVPWLSSVKLPWGPEVRLLNISSTGLLLETSCKLAPGSVTEVKLCGPDGEIAIPVCFVRSEVGDVDHMGVKYHTAATFEKALKLLGPHPVTRASSSGRTALSDLLSELSSELERGEQSLRTVLERSVRRVVVTARDIQVRDVPAESNGGSESIYFTIPTGVGAQPVLQAMFAPGSEPTDLDFRLLKAAAGFAAVALDFERSR